MSRKLCKAARLILLLASSPALAGNGPSLAGDCDRNGNVALSELILGVNVALDLRPIGQCSALDGNGDGAATVDELLAAVAASFGEVSPTPTETATATRTTTATSSPTPSPTLSPTPAVITLSGVCTRGLGRCPAGTTMRILRCPSPEGRACASDDASLVAVTTTGEEGVYRTTVPGEDVSGRALLIEADVAPQSTWRMMTFGALIVGRGAGTGGDLVTDIGPDTEAGYRLLSESGIDTFPPDEAESVFGTVSSETAQLPATLEELGIENPIEVAASYTGQAEANVAVRELLGMPTDTFLSVELTSEDGCVETGQTDRIPQSGFNPFVVVFSESKEGRLDDVPLDEIDEFFVIGQRRNDGSFRLLGRSNAYRSREAGPFRGELQVSSLNGTGTLNLEIQLHIKRPDVGAVPTPSLGGDGCTDQGPQRTCAKCTVPLRLE
jgi:hypothetical protein